MKMESLVIVDKNATVNIYPIFAHTARHAMGSSCIWNKKGLYKKIKKKIFVDACFVIFYGEKLWRCDKKLGRSRNKVVVGEPASGLND